ncbi:MAG: DUF3987 domain-containing protein [Gemmatimonadaceae bacterium]
MEAFSLDLLPETLRAWIRDIADRMQCPPDFAGVSCMVALGSVIGRSVGIKPKRHDDWKEVPNLWGGAVGRPGIQKSPAVAETLKPLKRLEIRTKQDYDDAMIQWGAMQQVLAASSSLRKKTLENQLKNHSKTASELAAEIAAECQDEPPVRRRLILNDSTVEKLGEILKDNSRGVLVFRDEFSGFLKSLDKEGHESARAFYLEAWNGTGSFTYDRIGRGND